MNIIQFPTPTKRDADLILDIANMGSVTSWDIILLYIGSDYNENSDKSVSFSIFCLKTKRIFDKIKGNQK